MHILNKRIKELRLDKNLTQKQLSEFLKVTTISVQRYEYGDRIPNLEQLIALADFFDVSLDYLVGRSDDPKRY